MEGREEEEESEGVSETEGCTKKRGAPERVEKKEEGV